jgi:hypothetical protein
MNPCGIIRFHSVGPRYIRVADPDSKVVPEMPETPFNLKFDVYSSRTTACNIVLTFFFFRGQFDGNFSQNFRFLG